MERKKPGEARVQEYTRKLKWNFGVLRSLMLYWFVSLLFMHLCLLAPAPIFAVKRPRQALLAHPNNYTNENSQAQPSAHSGAAVTFQVKVQVRNL